MTKIMEKTDVALICRRGDRMQSDAGKNGMALIFLIILGVLELYTNLVMPSTFFLHEGTTINNTTKHQDWPATLTL